MRGQAKVKRKNRKQTSLGGEEEGTKMKMKARKEGAKETDIKLGEELGELYRG